MIAADASALVSLASARVLGLALAAFDVHTTGVTVEALEEASAFHGAVGEGARRVIEHRDGLVVDRGSRDAIKTSRIDQSQGSCAALAVELDADVLLTDDLLAVAELDRLVPCAVAGSPTVLAALVRRDVLARRDAQFRLEALVRTRDWLGRPVFRRAPASLDETDG